MCQFNNSRHERMTAEGYIARTRGRPFAIGHGVLSRAQERNGPIRTRTQGSFRVLSVLNHSYSSYSQSTRLARVQRMLLASTTSRTPLACLSSRSPSVDISTYRIPASLAGRPILVCHDTNNCCVLPEPMEAIARDFTPPSQTPITPPNRKPRKALRGDSSVFGEQESQSTPAEPHRIARRNAVDITVGYPCLD